MTYKRTVNLIEADELMGRIKRKDSFILIDTLTGGHFKKVHIPGAHSACVFEITFLEQVGAIANSKKANIVLYGSSGRSMDALTAAEKLNREGYDNISVLNGGLAAWRARGFDLQGDQQNAADTETVLHLDDGQYRINIEESLVEWCGRNPNTTHVGTARLKMGLVEINDAVLTGVFDIDMETIDNINLKGDELHPVLISHLKSDDFFFVKMFPSAVLTINDGRAAEMPYLSSPNYQMNATLELRGLAAELDFQATVTNTDNGGLAAEAHFDIDRTRWNVIYGSARFFENLGMHLVFDLISFQVKIVTYRRSPVPG